MTEQQELKAEKVALKVEKVALAKEIAREIRARTVTLVTTAMALVAGLFWQTAINDTIKTFIPVSGAWQYEIVVALLITITAAIAIYLLSRSAEQKK
jgi:hypothetical protein